MKAPCAPPFPSNSGLFQNEFQTLYSNVLQKNHPKIGGCGQKVYTFLVTRRYRDIHLCMWDLLDTAAAVQSPMLPVATVSILLGESQKPPMMLWPSQCHLLIPFVLWPFLSVFLSLQLYMKNELLQPLTQLDALISFCASLLLILLTLHAIFLSFFLEIWPTFHSVKKPQLLFESHGELAI